MVGDPLADIVGGLRELTAGHDLVITSGGLGPTHDDRTVEALAEVAGVPLVVDEPILAQITAWTDSVAERLGFERSRFKDGNRKQARIPVGAVVLGLAGTAPGLVMEVNGAVVVVLPGVPSELRRLWQMAPAHPLVAPLVARGTPDGLVAGVAAYSNRTKHDLLGVSGELIDSHGSVSVEVARAMAEGARERLGVDVAVAVTGVAGPGGGTSEKPVGLVHLHVSSTAGQSARTMQWGGSRSDVRLRATAAALHLLREHLVSCP